MGKEKIMKVDLVKDEMFPIYYFNEIGEYTKEEDVVNIPKRLWNSYTKALRNFVVERQKVKTFLVSEGVETE